MIKTKHIALLIPLILACGCSEQKEEVKAEPSVKPVKIFEISDQQRSRKSSFPGVIKSKNLKEISFVSSGRVTEFPVQEAMEVKAGDVIASLDKRELNNQLKNAKSEFEIAEDEYQRILKLSKKGAVSSSDLQSQKVQRDVAKVKMDSAREAIEDSVLFAPFDGVIAQTLIEKDQVVSGGQTVAILIKLDELEASIDVPGKFLANLHINSLNNVTTESYVSLDSNPKEKFLAQFKEATLVADSTTQTYGLTFSFATPSSILVLPDMNVTVEINEKLHNTDQIYVPVSSLSRDVNGSFVWVVNTSSMSVTKRSIEVDEGLGDLVAIASGLSVGETIVSAGVSQLIEGMKVKEWKQD